MFPYGAQSAIHCTMSVPWLTIRWCHMHPWESATMILTGCAQHNPVRNDHRPYTHLFIQFRSIYTNLWCQILLCRWGIWYGKLVFLWTVPYDYGSVYFHVWDQWCNILYTSICQVTNGKLLVLYQLTFWWSIQLILVVNIQLFFSNLSSCAFCIIFSVVVCLIVFFLSKRIPISIHLTQWCQMATCNLNHKCALWYSPKSNSTRRAPRRDQ